MAFFGRSWAKIRDTPRTDTLPTVLKPQPGCPVIYSMPFQLFGTTRVLQIRFWPSLDHIGPFWALQGQNLGHPLHRHTPNCAKTSARMSCNLFHDIPTVWAHQSDQSQIFAIFCQFWTILACFGRSWTKIGETLALPTGSKLQPGRPVTCSTPFQPFWITRVLQQER